MTPDGALSVLGLDRGAAWSEIRARHRSLIRAAHPDAGGDAQHAAEVNEALAVLARLTMDGERSLAPEAPVADRLLRLDVAPTELLMRLADAGHDIGEVVFVDPHAGLLEIVVGDGSASAQLAVSVGAPGPDGVPVAFTLEPLAAGGSSPPIAEVVDALAAAVRSTR